MKTSLPLVLSLSLISMSVACAQGPNRMQQIVPPKATVIKHDEIEAREVNEFITIRNILTQSGIVSQTRIKQGGKSPHHNHPEEETIVLISGRLRVRNANGLTEMEPGDVFHIEPYAEHQMEALEDAFFIEAFGPGRVVGAPARQ